MGTRMAPSYTNLFMGNLERKILEKVDKRPDIWWRYIDDVFAIWPHGEERLIEFIEQINNGHSKIQFTAEWSNRSIAFHKVRVTIEEGCLTTDLFTKPTDTHQYLHKYSCHPAHCRSMIAYAKHCDYGRFVQMAKHRLEGQKNLKNIWSTEDTKGQRFNIRSIEPLM